MLTTLIAVWILHVAAMATPGANVLLVSQLAASDRASSAVFAALGVTLGALIWASSAVLGLHAIFQVFPSLRLALQIAGGLYLLLVASRLWRSGAAALPDSSTSVSRAAAFRLGFLTNITNPKSALFFGSVFAASFPSEPGAALQMAAVAMVVGNSLCWHMLLAFVFSRARVRTGYSRVRATANRVAAVVVGGLGLGLLAATVRDARA